MVAFDDFRQELARTLLDRAEARVGGGCVPSGEDIKVAALLRDLADDARNLDLRVFLFCQLVLTHETLARRYLRRRDDLLDQVGVTVWPRDATGLVRWMLGHVVQDGHVPVALVTQLKATVAAPPRVDGRKRPDRGGAGSPTIALPSVAAEFCAGVGIAAPLLSLHEASVGVGAWRERAAAAAHTATTATVVSVRPGSGGRGSTPSSAVTVSFRPYPGGSPCEVAVDLGRTAAPGEALAVVPRSPVCEAPIVVSRIGDPVATFELAAALMVAGGVALYRWDLLRRRRHRVSLWRAGSGAVGLHTPRSG